MLAVGVDCLDIFSRLLWEAARCRLKCCLKGPLNRNKGPTKSVFSLLFFCLPCPFFVVVMYDSVVEQRRTFSFREEK